MENRENAKKSLIYSPLPNEIIKSSTGELDLTCSARFTTELQRFVSSSTITLKPQKYFWKAKKSSKAKKHLSRRQRAAANLLKLPKTGYNYENMLPMHKMWLDYARDVLMDLQTPPTTSDGNYEQFHAVLGKMELVGALISVVQSKCPHFVALSGIIVLETKNSFQIVNKDNQLKILLKEPSVFQIKFRKMCFTIYGKYFLGRSVDRSVKKVKCLPVPTL